MGQGIDFAFNTINTSIETVKSFIDTVKSSINAVKSLIDTVKALFGHLLKSQQIAVNVAHLVGHKSKAAF